MTKYCVIAPLVTDRNARRWFDTTEEALRHAENLLWGQNRGRLMIVQAVQIVEKPVPQCSVRSPEEGDFHVDSYLRDPR